MQNTIVVVPGIGNSGSQHWQTIWEQRHDNFVRIQVPDWDAPQCNDWCEAINNAIRLHGASTIVVAHSLGCLAFAHWAAQSGIEIHGALLVAVPDPTGALFPGSASGFATMPATRFAFPSIVVASENDPYAQINFARQCAQEWGSRFVSAGASGHLNGASGLGDWPQGQDLLNELKQSKNTQT